MLVPRVDAGFSPDALVDLDAGFEDAGFETDTGFETDAGSSTTTPPSLDETIARLIQEQDDPPRAMTAPDPVSDQAYELGRALFFDPILSGPRDIACASCHNPDFGTSDGLSLTLGTGSIGSGPDRLNGTHPPFVPRHSMDLFNRGDREINSLFWDGRVHQTSSGTLTAPIPLPSGLDSPLAAQALFPLLDRLEMRGEHNASSSTVSDNELAAFDDSQANEIWAAITARLIAVPEYSRLFAEAYPNVAQVNINITHAVNALAAFQTRAFAATNTPWDNYLRGDLNALSQAQKLGAIFFFDSAKCGSCHSGALLSDQEFHNTAVPQIGSGMPGTEPYDYGRAEASAQETERFKFRTPPLRNVMHTAPYMHNGSLVDLQDVLKHYASPLDTAKDYDGMKLVEELRITIQTSTTNIEALTSSVSEKVLVTADGTSFIGLSNLRQFMIALSDPGIVNLSDIRPAQVPSGLTVP